MPGGLLVTVPVPFPAVGTMSVCVSALNVAVADTQASWPGLRDASLGRAGDVAGFVPNSTRAGSTAERPVRMHRLRTNPSHGRTGDDELLRT
jgi:hypothetical protein